MIRSDLLRKVVAQYIASPCQMLSCRMTAVAADTSEASPKHVNAQQHLVVVYADITKVCVTGSTQLLL